MRTAGIMVAGLMAFMATQASANGLFEDRSWQFEDSQEQSAKAMILDLRERKDGGYYGQWNIDQDFNCYEGSTCRNIGAGGAGIRNTSIGNYTDIDGNENSVSDQKVQDSNVKTESNLNSVENVGKVLHK